MPTLAGSAIVNVVNLLKLEPRICCIQERLLVDVSQSKIELLERVFAAKENFTLQRKEENSVSTAAQMD